LGFVWVVSNIRSCTDPTGQDLVQLEAARGRPDTTTVGRISSSVRFQSSMFVYRDGLRARTTRVHSVSRSGFRDIGPIASSPSWNPVAIGLRTSEKLSTPGREREGSSSTNSARYPLDLGRVLETVNPIRSVCYFCLPVLGPAVLISSRSVCARSRSGSDISCTRSVR
jgi:hypothetical protein